MENKPKIAVIGLKGLPAFGGAAAVGENIIEQLKDEYDFTVFSISSHTILPSGNYKNICYQKVFKAIPLKKLNSLLYYFRATIYVLFNKYDLIHLHHRAATIVIPFLRLKYRVILTTHGMEVETKFKKFKCLFDIQDKFCIRFANHITTVSLKDYRHVISLTSSNPKKISYIPNGIHNSKVTFNLPYFDQTDYLLFAAGRIFESKGCHLFLKSLIKLNYNMPVVIAGQLDDNQKYNELITNLINSITKAKFVGLIKEKDNLLKIISQAKLFIYPSYNESMSMMILEVVSQKTPIIIADIPENRDIFNSSHVLFSKPNNIDNLAEQIIWALNNYEQMKTKAENAYNLLIERYLWSDISEKYDIAFKTLIDR